MQIGRSLNPRLWTPRPPLCREDTTTAAWIWYMKRNIQALPRTPRTTPLTYTLAGSLSQPCRKQKSIRALARACARAFPSECREHSHPGRSLTCYESMPVFTPAFAPLLVPDSVINIHRNVNTRAQGHGLSLFSLQVPHFRSWAR